MRFITRLSCLALGIGFTLVLLSARPDSAAALACQLPATNHGKVTTTVNVPAGTYRVWSRIKIPSGSVNNYMLEVDDNTCFTVGGNANLTQGSWQWVDYQAGSSKVNLTFATTGSHKIELIGTGSGFMIDKVILTNDLTCTPNTMGTDCVGQSTNQAPSVSVTSPAAGAKVGDKVALKANASDDSGVINKVEFFVDGVPKGTATTGPYKVVWDSRSSLGARTVYAVAYDGSGKFTQSSPVGITVLRPGDVDGDGEVGLEDFDPVARNYQKTGTKVRTDGDLDGDGTVGYEDFDVLARDWDK